MRGWVRTLAAAAAAVTTLALGAQAAEAAPARDAPMTCTLDYRWDAPAFNGIGGYAQGTGTCVDQATGQTYGAQIPYSLINAGSVGCPPTMTYLELVLAGGPTYTLRWDQLSVPGVVGGLVNGILPGILPLPPLPDITIGSLNAGTSGSTVGAATLVGTRYCDVSSSPPDGLRRTFAAGQLTMAFLAPAANLP